MLLNRPPRSKPSLPTPAATNRASTKSKKKFATAPNPSAPTNLDTAAETPLRSAGGSGSGVGRGLRPQRFPRNHHPPRKAGRMVGGRSRAGNGACRVVVAPGRGRRNPRGVPDGGQVAPWLPAPGRLLSLAARCWLTPPAPPNIPASFPASFLPACLLPC